MRTAVNVQNNAILDTRLTTCCRCRLYFSFLANCGLDSLCVFSWAEHGWTCIIVDIKRPAMSCTCRTLAAKPWCWHQMELGVGLNWNGHLRAMSSMSSVLTCFIMFCRSSVYMGILFLCPLCRQGSSSNVFSCFEHVLSFINLIMCSHLSFSF